jgi:hypothetical protein
VVFTVEIRPSTAVYCAAMDQMSGKTWLDYVTAFGSVATPILVLLLGGVGWRIRSS